MAGVNIELPGFGADDLLDPQARQRIVSYLYRLAEQVKYLSTHIDGDNMTEGFAQEMVSTTSAKVKDELTGVLTEYDTKIEQNAREISLKASQTEIDALGEQIETATSEFSQTAEQLTTRVQGAEGAASEAVQTANGFSVRITGAESAASSAQSTANSARTTANNASSTASSANSRVSSLEISLGGVVASVNNNRLTFSAGGLTIKNASGQTVFSQNNSTGDLSITGSINATGGTIGGFTIGQNSITGPNGVQLYSSGSFSTVNNLWLGSGTDVFGNTYALLSQASGFAELRLGCATGDAASSGIRIYTNSGVRTVSFTYPVLVSSGITLFNLPTVSGVASNVYLDAGGTLHRIV